MPDPLPDGWYISLVRELPMTQQFLDIANQANVYPATLEAAADRIVMMIQGALGSGQTRVGNYVLRHNQATNCLEIYYEEES